jgi:hypothetical protein
MRTAAEGLKTALDGGRLWRDCGALVSTLFAQLASPDALVCVDQEGIDRLAVGLVAELRLEHQVLETLGLLVKSPEDVAERNLATTHPRADGNAPVPRSAT